MTHQSSPTTGVERIAITGATGLIGAALIAALRAQGRAVVTVGRDARSDVQWNPDARTINRAALAGVTAVVHLAGANIGQRWTRAHKRALVESRVAGTTLIARTIAELRPLPRVLLSASAVGYYGNRGAEWLSEESAAGTDFLGDLGARWELAAQPARDALARVVFPRTGVVLTRDGGALARMLPVFRAGLGAPLGDGTQWLSWITLSDTVRALLFLLDADSVEGPVNVVSPEPVTNAEFTQMLARTLHRPAFLPAVPKVLLRAMFGEMAKATVLASQRVRPERLRAAGFSWKYPALPAALRHELG